MSAVDVTRLRLAIVRLARRQRQQSDIDLTLGLQSALGIIDVEGPLTLGELAALEQVSAPTISRMVDRLEDRGLVTRTPDVSDRRCVRIEMTDAGRDQLCEARVRRDAWVRARLDALDDADREALAAAVGPLERMLGVDDKAPS